MHEAVESFCPRAEHEMDVIWQNTERMQLRSMDIFGHDEIVDDDLWNAAHGAPSHALGRIRGDMKHAVLLMTL